MKPEIKKWEPVIAPSQIFKGMVEQRAYQNAIEENPREPGEDVCEYLERINRRAREMPDPIVLQREPGDDTE